MRAVAQAGEDLGQFVGQHVAGVERDHLAEFHRRAAQLGELLGRAGDIAGGEDEIAQLRAFAGDKAPGALCQHIAGDPASQASHHTEAREPPLRNRARAAVISVIIRHAGPFRASSAGV
jgi:hypothetical protein